MAWALKRKKENALRARFLAKVCWSNYTAFSEALPVWTMRLGARGRKWWGTGHFFLLQNFLISSPPTDKTVLCNNVLLQNFNLCSTSCFSTELYIWYNIQICKCKCIINEGPQPIKMYYTVMVEVNFSYFQTEIIFIIWLVKICNVVFPKKWELKSKGNSELRLSLSL